jgi:hypothetical protein
VGAPPGGSRSDLFREKYIGEKDQEKMSKDLASTAKAMGIISVLIATVTFASAFTLPGGSYQSASDGGVPGTPILAGSYAFSAFILADALAFICSFLATFSVVIASTPAVELSVRHWYTNVSGMLLHASGRSLMASLGLGLYLVLAPTAHAIAVVVCVIIFGALVFGNREAWQMLCALNTAGARIGLLRFAAWCHLAPVAAGLALLSLAPLIIIFFLPAVIRNVEALFIPHSAIRKLEKAIAAELTIFVIGGTIIVGPPLFRLMAQRRKL